MRSSSVARCAWDAALNMARLSFFGTLIRDANVVPILGIGGLVGNMMISSAEQSPVIAASQAIGPLALHLAANIRLLLEQEIKEPF
jgi:hypothetical protein